MKYFSATIGGFLTEPNEDSVEISDDEWRSLLASEDGTRTIGADSDGRPVLVPRGIQELIDVVSGLCDSERDRRRYGDFQLSFDPVISGVLRLETIDEAIALQTLALTQQGGVWIFRGGQRETLTAQQMAALFAAYSDYIQALVFAARDVKDTLPALDRAALEAFDPSAALSSAVADALGFDPRTGDG